MSTITKFLSPLCGILLLWAGIRPAHSAAPDKKEVPAITAIPDGNYLVELQIRGEGPRHKLNLECKDGALKCVNTDESRISDWKGRSMFIGNGVFMVQLGGENERATQFWVFHADGTAAVKEVPDRGEKQTAVPVKGDGLEKP